MVAIKLIGVSVGSVGVHEMPLAVAIAGAAFVVLLAAAAVYSAYLLHVGLLDFAALAEKVDIPTPRSALDWPVLRIASVLAEPGDAGNVLVAAAWPARPEQTSVLVFRLAGGSRDLDRLLRWSAAGVALTSLRRPSGVVELRPRRRHRRVVAAIVEERRADGRSAADVADGLDEPTS